MKYTDTFSRTRQLLQSCESSAFGSPTRHVLKSMGKTPWIGIRVVICGKKSSLRTKIGTVRDVICGQDNESGLRVVIIPESYDPSITNKEYTVDYEHVLEVT